MIQKESNELLRTCLYRRGTAKSGGAKAPLAPPASAAYVIGRASGTAMQARAQRSANNKYYSRL